MRRTLLVAVVVAGICCSTSAKELKLLCLGNSLTQNATKYLPQIVQSSPDCKLDLAIVYLAARRCRSTGTGSNRRRPTRRLSTTP